MTIKEARQIIKQHYSESGESATVIKKLTKEVDAGDFGTITYEAFLCHVKTECFETVPTICTIWNDRYNKPYATEFMHGLTDEEVMNEWGCEE